MLTIDDNKVQEGTLGDVDAEFHRAFAVRLFQFVWALLEREERTQEQVDAMINAAHASRFHWAQLGTAMHVAYGEWQISRVYAVLERWEPALYHARRCLAICEEDRASEFAESYAYEALSRAYAGAHQREKAQEYFDLARKAGSKMESLADREMLARDLLTIPGVEPEKPSKPSRRRKRVASGVTVTVSEAPEETPVQTAEPSSGGRSRRGQRNGAKADTSATLPDPEAANGKAARRSLGREQQIADAASQDTRARRSRRRRSPSHDKGDQTR